MSSVVHPGVSAYVAAVRAQLDDLTGDEIDELTGGLEADLDDALDDVAGPADGGPAAGQSLEERFGPPAVYAAELRAAAGLPPRAELGGGHGAAGRSGAVQRLADRRRELVDRVTAHPRWPAVRDFVVMLRPAWWVARAVLAVYAIEAVLGNVGVLGTLVLLVVAVVISAELGRRDVAGRGLAWRIAIGAGNALAVLILLALGPTSVAVRTEVVSQQAVPSTGVWVDGSEVRNIFPYDDHGRPLAGVQLYDQDGRPVQVGDDARQPQYSTGPGTTQVPAVDSASQQRWNVFPLRQQGLVTDEQSGEEKLDPAGPRPATLPNVSPGPLIAGGSADSMPTSSMPTSAAPVVTAGSTGSAVTTAPTSSTVTTAVTTAPPAPSTTGSPTAPSVPPTVTTRSVPTSASGR